MNDQLAIVLVAAAPGAMVGLLSLGLITIYRSSGVLYLAQTAMATLGGFLYYELARPGRLHDIPGVIAAALLTGVVSIGVYAFAMRPLVTHRRYPPRAHHWV